MSLDYTPRFNPQTKHDSTLMPLQAQEVMEQNCALPADGSEPGQINSQHGINRGRKIMAVEQTHWFLIVPDS